MNDCELALLSFGYSFIFKINYHYVIGTWITHQAVSENYKLNRFQNCRFLVDFERRTSNEIRPPVTVPWTMFSTVIKLSEILAIFCLSPSLKIKILLNRKFNTINLNCNKNCVKMFFFCKKIDRHKIRYIGFFFLLFCNFKNNRNAFYAVETIKFTNWKWNSTHNRSCFVISNKNFKL